MATANGPFDDDDDFGQHPNFNNPPPYEPSAPEMSIARMFRDRTTDSESQANSDSDRESVQNQPSEIKDQESTLLDKFAYVNQDPRTRIRQPQPQTVQDLRDIQHSS